MRIGKTYLIMPGYMHENKGIAEVIFASRFKNEAENMPKQKSVTNSDFYMLYETPVETYLPDQGHWPSIEFHREEFN